MRFFGPVPPTRFTSTPSSRAYLRTEGLACAALPTVPTVSAVYVAGAAAGAAAGATGAGLGAAATGAGAGACAGAGAGAAAPPAPSSTTISVPSDTASPTFTRMSLTVPAAGDGTSIVALSDSSVISDCSASTLSPTFTLISMTGTSL